jgi:outer membrane protein TolC
MKVLNVLVLSSLLFSSTVFSQDNQNTSLESYLSSLKQQEFSFDYEKNENESSKLRDSWIQPLRLEYSFSRSNPYKNISNSQNARIVIDQPIFQSGGIFYGIKFAQASRKYNNFSIDVQKRKLIKDTVSLLLQIRQHYYKIEKQNLVIDNAKINVEQQTERYLSGQLDSGFLDNAIIEANAQYQVLYNFETAQQRLISRYKALSDLDYKTAPIPHLSVISQDDFMQNNYDVYLAQSDAKKRKYNKNIVIAKYLPKVSISGSYAWDKKDSFAFNDTGAFPGSETDYYSYGMSASMPLDFNSIRDVQSAKVDHLKSLVIIDDKKRELTALYEQVSQNLQNLDKKKKLAIKNRELYEKLYSDTVALFKAGYKTDYDVKTLNNSVKSQNVEITILELDKQLELLDLYEKLVSSNKQSDTAQVTIAKGNN